MQHTVIIEKGESSFGAYVPDLPGCIAVSETREEVTQLTREAIEFHLEGMREDGLTIPEPASSSALVEVAAERRCKYLQRLGFFEPSRLW